MQTPDFSSKTSTLPLPEQKPATSVAKVEHAPMSVMEEVAMLREADEKRSADKLAILREKVSEDSMVDEEYRLIANDPELHALYRGIIEAGDFTMLRQKSSRQYRELLELYFGPNAWLNALKFQKKAKLESFQQFVANLQPVRNDENVHEVFVSPEKTGNVQSYWPQDILVHAEQFVYGSYGEIGHLMSQWSNQHQLDVDDIAPRAQIAMNDVSNLNMRTAPGVSFMKKYLDNLFDFENGQKILAVYLALVFETPEHAHAALSTSRGYPMHAQHWDSMDLLYYQESGYVASSRDDSLAQEQREASITQAFLEKMKFVLEKTGIEPPLSLEIRVKDSARVKK